MMFIINGEQWTVLRVAPDDPRMYRSDGSLTVASCDDPTKTIYINGQITGEFLKKVLCHEITHAAMFSYNVDLTIDQEELLADLIATYGDEIVNITNEVFSKISRGF